MKRLNILLALLVFTALSAFSQGIKISALPAATSVSAADKLLIQQGSATKGAPVSTVETYIKGNAAPASNTLIQKPDSNYSKPGSYTSRYDFKNEATNQELWKMWKAGGATVSKLMPVFPLVNVGGTVLTNGRMYVYMYYTPDTITLTGFNLILSAQGNYTGDGAKFNGIKVGRYSNDSVYIIGGTTNDTEFWKGAANAVVQKPLATPLVLYPGIWAIMPLYNYITTQTAAPAIEATYVSSMAKAITFRGGWHISSYINSVGIPAASYKYSGSVSGESAVPHIILGY